MLPDPLYPGNEVISSQSYSYDKLGRVVSETDGNGQTVTYSYSGRTVKTLTPTIGLNGSHVVVLSQTTYDTGGNVIRSVNEANGTTSATYDAFGHTKLTINEEGQQISYVTDAYGRTKQRVEQVDRTGRTQRIAYSVDAWGNVSEEKRELNDGAWATTVSKYSPEGDLLQTTDPSGLVTDYAYDKHGRLQQLQETDRTTGSVRVTAYGNDIMGRQTSVVQPDGSRERSVYDTMGRGIVSLDGLNHASANHYDLSGNLLEQIEYKEGATDLSPANISTLTRYVVNGAGSTVLVQDPNGNVTRSAYDANGYLVAETNYEHPDLTGEQIVNSYAYDPRGLLLASTDGNGHTTTYGYDAKGQQVLAVDPSGHWVKNEYSPAGFMTAERLPLGRGSEWTYDYRGNKLQEKDPLGNEKRFELDIDGRMSTEYNGLGEATHYGYDNAGQMTSKQTPNAGTYSYQYDSVGNKLAETKPVYGTTSYDYDKRDSLTAVTEPQTKTAYTYDADLNRTSQTDGNTQVTTYAYDELNRRVAKTVVRPESGSNIFVYTYDPNGNLLTEIEAWAA